MVGFGEQRISVLTTPNAPLTLPTGWPYDAISQIVAVRAAIAATPAVDPAAVAPTVVAPVDPATPTTSAIALPSP